MATSLNDCAGDTSRTVVPLDILPGQFRVHHQELFKAGFDLRYPIQLYLWRLEAEGTFLSELVEMEITAWLDSRKIRSARDLLMRGVYTSNTDRLIRYSQKMARWITEHLYNVWFAKDVSCRIVVVTETFLVIDVVTRQPRNPYVNSLPSRASNSTVVPGRTEAERAPLRLHRP